MSQISRAHHPKVSFSSPTGESKVTSKVVNPQDAPLKGILKKPVDPWQMEYRPAPLPLPTGLANLGATCYANVFFQVLNSLAVMQLLRRAPLMSGEINDGNRLARRFLRRIQQTLVAMVSGSKHYTRAPLSPPPSAIPKSTLKVIGAVMGIPSWNSQQDATELLEHFFEALSTLLPHVYLHFRVVGSGSCPAVASTDFERPSASWCLTVPFPADTSRLDLSATLASAVLLGKGEMNSGGDGASGEGGACPCLGENRLHIFGSSLPAVLAVHVPRFDGAHRHRQDVQLELSGGAWQPVASQAIYRLTAAIAYWGVDGSGGGVADFEGDFAGGQGHFSTGEDASASIVNAHAAAFEGSRGDGEGACSFLSVLGRLGANLSSLKARIAKWAAKDASSQSSTRHSRATASPRPLSSQEATSLDAGHSAQCHSCKRSRKQKPKSLANRKPSWPFSPVLDSSSAAGKFRATSSDEDTLSKRPAKKEQKLLKMMVKGWVENVPWQDGGDDDEEDEEVVDSLGYNGPVQFLSLEPAKQAQLPFRSSTSGQSGHYTAYVARGNRWYHINDSHVEQVKVVYTDHLSVLFYERV